MANLYDKTITWGDGTTERWIISGDGYFHKNGVKQRLIGIDLGLTGFTGNFWDAGNLTLINTELADLASKGVRIVHMNLFDVGEGTEAARYAAVLDLCYNNKMLVVPLLTGKWEPNFGDLETLNYEVAAGYTLSEWVTAWCAVVDNYDNVVALAVENELDLPIAPQAYTAQAASDYMDYLVGLFRAAIPDRPIVTKLMGYFPGGATDALKVAVADSVDIIGFDTYMADADAHRARCLQIRTWLSDNSYAVKGWWMTEINATGPTTADFDSDFIKYSFQNGAAVVMLWVAHREQALEQAFYDAAGDPVATMTTISADFATLQSSTTLELHISPSKDTEMQRANATTNYGSATYMDVSNYKWNGGAEMRFILEFDLANLLAEGTVTLVTSILKLYYYAMSNNPNGQALYMYKLSQTGWVEAQATWNIYSTGNNWSTAGGDFVTSNPAGVTAVMPAAYGWVSWNVQTLLQDALDTSVDLELLSKFLVEQETPRYDALFRSKNYAVDTTLRPILIVEYTLPVTVDMSSCAGVALADINSISGVAIASIEAVSGVV